jgi:hypothetical protein
MRMSLVFIFMSQSYNHTDGSLIHNLVRPVNITLLYEKFFFEI